MFKPLIKFWNHKIKKQSCVSCVFYTNLHKMPEESPRPYACWCKFSNVEIYPFASCKNYINEYDWHAIWALDPETKNKAEMRGSEYVGDYTD